jgi:hypothetical protein
MVLKEVMGPKQNEWRQKRFTDQYTFPVDFSCNFKPIDLINGGAYNTGNLLFLGPFCWR